MAPKLFETDSDDDSIRTDYTTEADPATEYDIEKILQQDGDDYQIKWAGYPVTESTWEPRDKLPPDDNELFIEWRRHLQAVRDGRETPFDVKQYEEEWHKHRAEQNERRARRNAKRRKKNLPTRPDTIDEEEELTRGALEEEDLAERARNSDEEQDFEDEPLATRTKKARQPPQQPVQRKGVAQRVTKRRHEQQSSSSSSGNSSEDTSEDSEDSLMEEIGAKQAKTRTSPIKRPLREEVTRKPSHSAVSSPKRQRLSSSSAPQPTRGDSVREKSMQQRGPAPMRTLSIQSGVPAGKNVPSRNVSGTSPARAKKSKNVMSNWDADKQRRKRVPALGSISAETSQSGFLHLRMQNEVQKKARLEPAPDVSALNIIDPKTGNVVVPSRGRTDSAGAQEAGAIAKPAAGQSRTTTNTAPATLTSGIHGAYARRSPPPDSRIRDAMPSRSASGSASVVPIEDSSERQPTVTGDRNPMTTNRAPDTCRFWLEGRCQDSAQDCRYSHFLPVGDATKLNGEYASRLRLPPKDWVYDPSQLRCHFLRTQGSCEKGDRCKYAHHDTGYDAPPPKVTIEDARASQVAYARRIMSPAEPATVAPPQPAGIVIGDATKISGQVAMKLRLPPPEWFYRAGGLFCHFFRTNGSCKMGSFCKYAHVDTGYDAPPPGVTIEDARASQAAYASLSMPPAEPATIASRDDASVTTGVSEATTGALSMHEPMSKDPQMVRQHPGRGKQGPARLTCFFWRTQDHCRKGDTCPYSHFDTGFDALPPKGYQPPVKQIDASKANANMEPVGYQRWTPGTDTERMKDSVDKPAFGDPQHAKMSGLPPLQTDFALSSDTVMSPGQILASPVHTSLSDSRRASTTAHSLWSGHDKTSSLVTRNAIVKLYHQGSERPHSVRLKLDVLGDRTLTRLIGEEPSMRVERAILTSSVKALLWDDMQHSPNAAAGVVHMDVSPEHEMSGLAELCKLHDCALLAAVEGYSANILIYPSNAEQWKFLEAPGLLSGGGASLKFCVFDGCPDLRSRLSSDEAPVRSDRRSSAIIVGEVLAQLERDRIFPKDVDAVFLMIPPAHAAELEVLKRVFAAESRCKVYHSGTAGAWQYFCKKYDRSGVVLVHPDVPLWQIPKLHEVTLQAPLAFFTIGIDMTSAVLNDRKSVFECTRLLPLGGATLLTDELIVHHPEKATEIIQNFLYSTSCKPEGAEMNKIVARPGLKRFLLDNFIERGRPDHRWLRLYGAVCDLCPSEDEDQEDPPNPLATSHLVSVNPALLPSFAELREHDEHAADDLLVEWFAGWALLNASKLRKFAVVTETGIDHRGWAKKYQHIGVMKPEKAMKYLIKGKPQKGVRNWTSSTQ